MNLAAILSKFLSGRDTGQLVVKFAGAQHLCKISIDSGAAVYISLGTLGPDETLDYIADKQALQANFIEGVPARKKLDEPLNDRLFALAQGGAVTAAPAPAPARPEPKPAAGDGDNGPITSQQVQATINDFIDLVGPLGTVMADNALSGVGYVKGSGMSLKAYANFLAELEDEIPEGQRKAFLSRHHK